MVDRARAHHSHKERRRTATKSPLIPHLDHDAEPRSDAEVDGLRPARKSKPLTKDWRPWNQQGEGEPAGSGLADDSDPPEGVVKDWEWRNRNVPCKGLPCKDSESQSDH